MKIRSTNEWERLRTVIVGTAVHANWPTKDREFRDMEETTRWKETPVPSGPVEQHIIDETEQELQDMCDTLARHGVLVLRPDALDYQARDGMYGYCPRDRLLVLGDQIIDCNMRFPCRKMEIESYQFLDVDIQTIDDEQVVFDAANVLRMDNDLLYLVSDSGNRQGAEWLTQQFPYMNIHVLDNIYQGVHIDSTITVLNEGTVVLNGGRINSENMPEVFAGHDIIWVTEQDIVPMGFYKYPYASQWMAMNMLSLDRHTVMVDRDQDKIIRKLEQRNFTVIPSKLTHARTLGGGFHCCTLDLWRED